MNFKKQLDYTNIGDYDVKFARISLKQTALPVRVLVNIQD